MKETFVSRVLAPLLALLFFVFGVGYCIGSIKSQDPHQFFISIVILALAGVAIYATWRKV